jgi:hypothetical protein
MTFPYFWYTFLLFLVRSTRGWDTFWPLLLRVGQVLATFWHRFFRVWGSFFDVFLAFLTPFPCFQMVKTQFQRKISRRRVLLKRLALKIEKFGAIKRATYGSSAVLCSAVVARGFKCTVSTIKRDLFALNFRSRVRPVVTNNSSDQMRVRRLTFATEHVYSGLDGRQIVFSDEKVFTSNDHTVRTQYVLPGQLPETRECKRWPATIMVWGAIGMNFRKLVVLPAAKKAVLTRKRRGEVQTVITPAESGALTSPKYQELCLKTILPHFSRHPNLIFMQDGAGCHRAEPTMEYLAAQNITLLENWPPSSPDLNPIEHLWSFLARKVSERGPADVEELTKYVLEEWNRVPRAQLNHLVRSFQRRLETCKKKKGGFCKVI